MNVKLCEVTQQLEHLSEDAVIKGLDHSRIRDYAYILHDSDDTAPHWHIAIRLKDSYDTKYIAEWFGVKENYVEKVKGRWADMLSYLIHENAPSKFQYSDDKVKSNFDWKKEKEQTKGEKRLNEIVEMINNGTIREYNKHEHMTIAEYVRYKVQINSAFDYVNSRKGISRNMECVFITGDAGSGKTTYAKDIAKQKNYSIFIADSGKNPLDGYGGEDCIILDDLRGSTMKVADLLKLLDNNTACAVSARYRNKNIAWCKLIIITTVQDIDQFFRNVFQDEIETANQLKRRCRYVVHMTKSKMWFDVWTDAEQKYISTKPVGNVVMEQFSSETMTVDDAIDLVDKFFGLGNEVKAMMKEETHQVDDDDLPFQFTAHGL